MLHDCDTCDETFDEEEASHQHMREMGHAVNSDTSEYRAKNASRVATAFSSGCSSSSSDSVSVDLDFFLEPVVSDRVDDDVESLDLGDTSSLNGSSDGEEKGVAVLVLNLPGGSLCGSTEHWVSDQVVRVPVSKKKLQKQEKREMEMEVKKKEATEMKKTIEREKVMREQRKQLKEQRKKEMMQRELELKKMKQMTMQKQAEQMKKQKQMKQKATLNSITCDTCGKKFTDREAVENHMAAKDHYRRSTRHDTR